MNKGFIFALITAIISGMSVFLNGYAVTLADPTAYTLLKNIGALMFLVSSVILFKELNLFKSVSKSNFAYLIAVGILGGSIPFILFFEGLNVGGSEVSSFIYRSIFIFAGIFGYFLLKEKPDRNDFFAGAAILVGNLLLVKDFSLGQGQILVLVATLFWALEYTISRKLLSDIEPKVVMVSRMFFGSIVIFGYLFVSGGTNELFSVNIEVIQWLLLTSVFLASFLYAWYNSLKYLPVIKATLVLALGGVVTSGLVLIFKGSAISIESGLGLFLIVLGSFIVLNFSQIKGLSNEWNRARF